MIYADHAATTPLCQQAYEAMLPYLYEQYGNPSSLYHAGMQARKAVSRAREQIAQAIGALPEQILFTASGSESDSWVLHNASICQNSHIITTEIEHHAILNTCRLLEQSGRVELSFLKPDSYGRICLESLEQALRKETKLVSIMTANNEVGTVNDIASLTQCAHQHGVLFHTDAVQAVGHIPISVADTDVDFLSASAHKFNGPKGVGFLYCKNPQKLFPLIGGGQQEFGLRGGTENVAGIVGMGAAINVAMQHIHEYAEKMCKLRKVFIEALQVELSRWHIIADNVEHLESIVSLVIDGVRGEVLLQRLDLRGICVSTGSACNSRETIGSHVLKAIGMSERETHSVIRISFGMSNTCDEAIILAKEIAKAVASLRNTK